jgi:hypothetical protein
MNLDLNQLLNTLIAGGAIWAAIRIEIKFLWRDVEALKKQLESHIEKAAK